jgi:hypothetical protein
MVPRSGSARAKEVTMARGEKRGNREVKKPKQDKPKNAPAPSPFTTMPGKGNPGQRPSGDKK